MIRVDTVTGVIAIDTETRQHQERIVITRGPTGVQIRYEQPVAMPPGSCATHRTLTENGKMFFARVLEFTS